MIKRIAAAAVAALVVAFGVAYFVWRDAGATRITAEFSEAVGVYAGSDVRVLGVAVGHIDAVHAQASGVRVEMSIRHGIAIPAGALAVVVAPSLVSDRYVQLSPPYTGGARLADHGTIPASRTATPVELDQLYQSLNQIASALGPNGANAGGALSDVINTGADNLDGSGKDLGNTIDQLGKATRTLSGSEDDLFGTIDNLDKFTTMLKENDASVRQAEDQLRSVAGFLADDRQSLGAALDELATALDQLTTFIKQNESHIKSNVDKLAAITQVLVKEKQSLSEALDDIPLAATNLLNAYDPTIGTFDGRANLNELSIGSPATTDDPTAALALPLPTVGSVQTTKAGN